MDRLKNILAQRLEAEPSPQSEHLSADALGALVEQRLRASERERALHHLAACPLCREAVTLAAAEIPNPAEASITPARGRFAKWSTFPFASAAAVLAVAIGAGVLVYEHQQPIAHSQIRAAEAAPAASAPTVMAETQPPASPSAPNDEPQHNSKASPKLAQDHFGKRGSLLEAKSSPTPEAEASRSRRQSHSDLASAAPAPSFHGSASPSTLPGVLAGAAPANSSAQASLPPAASSDLTLTAQSAAKEQETVARKAMRANAVAGPVRTVASNGELVSWRVSSSGQLERRSPDGGLTLIQPAPGFSVRTIAADGIEVWAAGQRQAFGFTGKQNTGDALYHSSDAGQTWTQVPGPWRESITRVSMLPQGGVGVATQKSSWITRDGGQSWTQASQQ